MRNLGRLGLSPTCALKMPIADDVLLFHVTSAGPQHVRLRSDRVTQIYKRVGFLVEPTLPLINGTPGFEPANRCG